MHIKIDHRHPVNAPDMLRMPRRNSRTGEQTKSHRLFWFGMMPGRAHGTKCRAGLVLHHKIDGKTGTTDRALGCFNTMRACPGIGVQRHQIGDIGGGLKHLLDIAGTMHKFELIAACFWCLMMRPVQKIIAHGRHDRTVALGPFRMPRRHLMQPRYFMDYKSGLHRLYHPFVHFDLTAPERINGSKTRKVFKTFRKSPFFRW